MKLAATAILLTLFAIGCAKLDEKFVLNPDGSGSLSVHLELNPKTVTALTFMSGGDWQMLPMALMPATIPMTEDSIRALGNADVIIKHIQVTDLTNGGKRLNVLAEFTSISKFVRSKAARYFPFRIDQTEQKNSIRFHSAVFSREFDEYRMSEVSPISAKSIAGAIRLQMQGFVFHFTVQLPGKILSSNTRTYEGNTAVWSFEADKLDEQSLPNLAPLAVFDSADVKFTVPVGSFYGGYEAIPEFETGFRQEISRIPPQLAGEGFGAFFTRFNFQKSIDLSPGSPLKVSGNFAADLRVFYPEGLFPISYCNFSLSQVLTDAGEDLASRGSSSERERSLGQPWRDGVEQTSFVIYVDLETPKRPVKSITLAKGSLELMYATSARTVIVDNPLQWVGKRIDVPELATFNITLKEVAENFVKMRFSEDTYTLLKSITFRDAQGIKLEPREGWHYAAPDTYLVSLPEDGSIVFEMAQEFKNVLITVELKDILLDPESQKLPFE
jgi:hypothetical protein